MQVPAERAAKDSRQLGVSTRALLWLNARAKFQRGASPSMSEFRILDCGDGPQGRKWIGSVYNREPGLLWEHISAPVPGKLARRLPGPSFSRIRAGLQARTRLAAIPFDLLVSHGPRMSYYMQRIANPAIPHLAWSFNFTDLPTGYRLDAMRRSFAKIDRFISFSRVECPLYAQLFEVPIDRFKFAYWGVNPPIRAPLPRRIAQPYFAALGGEARDYVTLCDAARRMPHLHFAAVVRPHSLRELDVPDNMRIFVNLPLEEAWSIVWHAEAAIVPLRDAQTPNGHVTLVGGMHLGKAQIVTDSSGVADYLEQRETALLVPPRDPASLARAIEELADNRALGERIGAAAQAFAARHCTEQSTVDAFHAELIDLVPSAGASSRQG